VHSYIKEQYEQDAMTTAQNKQKMVRDHFWRPETPPEDKHIQAPSRLMPNVDYYSRNKDLAVGLRKDGREFLLPHEKRKLENRRLGQQYADTTHYHPHVESIRQRGKSSGIKCLEGSAVKANGDELDLRKYMRMGNYNMFRGGQKK
jgi:hypothetical protein